MRRATSRHASHPLHAEEMRHLLQEEDETLRAAGIVEEAGAGEQHGYLVAVALQSHLTLDRGAPGERVVEPGCRWPNMMA